MGLRSHWGYPGWGCSRDWGYPHNIKFFVRDFLGFGYILSLIRFIILKISEDYTHRAEVIDENARGDLLLPDFFKICLRLFYLTFK